MQAAEVNSILLPDGQRVQITDWKHEARFSVICDEIGWDDMVKDGYSGSALKARVIEVLINRDELKAALKRVRPDSVQEEGSGKNSFVVTHAEFSAEGEVLVIEAQGDGGFVRDEIEVEREGDEIAFALDVDYAIETLDALTSDAVYLEGTEHLSPFAIRPVSSEDVVVVLMPRQRRRE